MAGFNLPEELLYSGDIKKKKPLLDLMSSAEDEVRSPNGAPTPYTVMQNAEAMGPQPQSPPQRYPQLDASLNAPARGPSQEDPQGKHLRNLQLQAIREGIDAQKAAIPDLEGVSRKIDLSSGRTDFSPLLALTDTWTGSDFSKSYKAPDSPEDLAYKKAQINQMIQKSKGDITSQEINLLKNLEDSKNMKALIDSDREKSRAQRWGDTNIFNAEKKLLDDVTKNVADPVDKFTGFYDKTMKALDSGNYGRISQELISIARNIGEDKGPLSDTDVGRQLLPTLEADIAKLSTYLSSQPQDALDPKVVQSLKENIMAAKNKVAAIARAQLHGRRGRMAVTSFYGPLFQEGGSGNRMIDFELDKIDKTFGKEESQKQAAVPAAQQTLPAAPAKINLGATMSFDDFKASKKKK